MPVGSGAWPGFEVRHNRAGTAGVQGTGGSEGPGCGAHGRWQDTSETKVARNFPRSLLKTAQKRCNSNDANSNSEIVTGELRAKLLSSRQDGATHSRTSRTAGVKGAGGTQAWLRCSWAAAGPGRTTSRRAEPSSRRGRLAGGPPPTAQPGPTKHTRHPERQRRYKQQRAARTASGRAAARSSSGPDTLKPRPADAGRGLPTQSGGRV